MQLLQYYCLVIIYINDLYKEKRATSAHSSIMFSIYLEETTTTNS